MATSSSPPTPLLQRRVPAHAEVVPVDARPRDGIGRRFRDGSSPALQSGDVRGGLAADPAASDCQPRVLISAQFKMARQVKNTQEALRAHPHRRGALGRVRIGRRLSGPNPEGWRERRPFALDGRDRCLGPARQADTTVSTGSPSRDGNCTRSKASHCDHSRARARRSVRDVSSSAAASPTVTLVRSEGARSNLGWTRCQEQPASIMAHTADSASHRTPRRSCRLAASMRRSPGSPSADG